MTIQHALDTETTGLDPESGDRIVEIGVVEMNDGLPTGRSFHAYVDPLRDVPAAAAAVHGLTRDFLRGKPTFDAIADEFLAFIGDAPLVIHNAEFDAKFLDAELSAAGKPKLDRTRIIDSIDLARRKFPGQPASLDALCRRFKISLADRDLHGAMLDAKLLAEVYLNLTGGRQGSLELLFSGQMAETQETTVVAERPRSAIAVTPSESELAAHAALVSKLKNPIWSS
jgi:DNA polymerase-3 subunit epsilon